jgi:hypothetical protein
MIGIPQKFKKAILYPLVFAMGLSSTGCVTTSTDSNINRRYATSTPRITFVEEKPQTVDELVNSYENLKETAIYRRRLESIKTKIKGDMDYNPRQDLRSLVWNIEKSDIKNKDSLADSVRNLSYYREDVITTKRDVKLWEIDEIWTYAAVGTTLAVLANTYDPEEENNGDAILGSALAGSLVWFVGYHISHSIVGDDKETKTSKKVLIKPYFEKRF